MNRRNFVRAGVAGAVALATTKVSVADRKAVEGSRTSVSAPAAFELDEATIAELQSGMSSGKYTAHSLARKYLDRIDDIDKRGPAINSVIELNPEALSIASELDKERKAGRMRGPLHGVPLLIKDNIDTHDRMTTTAGSLALAGSIPLQDSTVAKKLRDAGAVILGKTNLSEWRIFDRVTRRVVGAVAGDKPTILTCSIATRADQVQELAPRSRRILPRSVSALKLTVQ